MESIRWRPSSWVPMKTLPHSTVCIIYAKDFWQIDLLLVWNSTTINPFISSFKKGFDSLMFLKELCKLFISSSEASENSTMYFKSSSMYVKSFESFIQPPVMYFYIRKVLMPSMILFIELVIWIANHWYIAIQIHCLSHTNVEILIRHQYFIQNT